MSKSESKKYIVAVWLFLMFDFFLSLFSMLIFSLLLYQAISRWLASFLRRFFTLLRRTLGSTWKQIQVEIKFLTRKAVVKISRISNSKNPPWNLAKFCSEIFLVNVWRIVGWGFPVFIVIGKTIKTPGFYNNVHLHICSIYLTLDVSSLTEL